MKICNLGYLREKTIQNHNNINNINLTQFLIDFIETKKEIQGLKTKEFNMDKEIC